MSEVTTKQARVLPGNLEAEQSILGCCLIDTDLPNTVFNELTAKDFYSQVHAVIFEAMYKIFARSAPIDFVTLSDELMQENKLDSVGGLEYITTLTNIVPSSANFMQYIEIIKRDSLLRQLINCSKNIIEKSFNSETEDGSDVVDFAEKSLYEITERGQKSTLTHIAPAVDQVLKEFEDIQRDKTSMRGIPTGFYALDKITNGLQRSDLILLAARPGVGKTSFAMNIMTNVALQGKKCAIFSLEMPASQIAQRCMCSIASVSMAKPLAGEMDGSEWQAMLLASQKMKEIDLYVDDSSDTNPNDILAKCRKLKREKGLDVVMIDYLQLMSSPKARDNRQLEISEFTRRLKVAARELDVPIILLSQLNRAVETREDHTPVLADLRESGSIEQDADIVIFINKPDKYPGYTGEKDLCDIIIAKHRNGALGTIKLKWRGELTTFVNLDADANKASLEASEPKLRTKVESAPFDLEEIDGSADIF